MYKRQVFGASGDQIVVEEFITGPEVSVLAFTDGKGVKPMVSSKDHKRALDNDQGLNTGGMGTISPNPHYTEEMAQTCMETIFLPTIRARQAEGRPFKGCLYFGLMPVSYTHLDVYKRQVCGKAFIAHAAGCRSNGLKPPYFVDSPWKSGPALHISG